MGPISRSSWQPGGPLSPNQKIIPATPSHITIGEYQLPTMYQVRSWLPFCGVKTPKIRVLCDVGPISRQFLLTWWATLSKPKDNPCHTLPHNYWRVSTAHHVSSEVLVAFSVVLKPPELEFCVMWVPFPAVLANLVGHSLQTKR